MGLVGIIKDRDEKKKKQWMLNEVQEIVQMTSNYIIMLGDCWRYSMMLFPLVVLFMRNKKKYVTNILEMNKTQQ